MREPSLTIVGLGDSTTAGTPGFRSPLEVPPRGEGNPESQYAHWMMRSHPEWTVLNRGVNGETAEEIRARLPRDVLLPRPAYAIILAGVNDIFGGQGAESVERHLAAMYADVLDAGVVPVAATVLPYNSATARASGEILALNAWIENLTKVLGILFCDTHAAVADPADSNRLKGTPDGLHPDVAGYRAMGEVLARTIEDHLRRSAPR
ncbi:MAG TPA: GDSL-type esterase/lipase family protein [Thermoplasmata archaeon]|nr:GDSL-type esterase/lipase family protein [Thermoplasmata archaeon]